MTANDRRLRRLLRAYPGDYRRRHGDEIVATLLDLAEDGRGRSAGAQQLHLVVCGLRQRFRLPAGRPQAAIAAVLAMVALGAAGAAGGTWLGWQTAAPLPSSTELRGLTSAMSGMKPSDVPVYPWQTAMNGPVAGVTARGTVPYAADRIRQALTTDGWRITKYREDNGAVVPLTVAGLALGMRPCPPTSSTGTSTGCWSTTPAHRTRTSWTAPASRPPEAWC